jgi:hypothetical protein
MPNYTAAVAAATGVVGYDLFQDQVWARTPVDRVIQGVALTGSAVIGDTEVELFVDEVRIGDYFNSKLLIANIDDLLPVGNLGVPAGALLRAIVRDAPATNTLFTMIQIANTGGGGGRRR